MGLYILRKGAYIRGLVLLVGIILAQKPQPSEWFSDNLLEFQDER